MQAINPLIYVGSSIGDSDIAASLEQHAKKSLATYGHVTPCQSMMPGTKVSAEDTDNALATIQAYGLQYFIHSAFSINLSDAKNSDWNVTLLKQNLEWAKEVGAQGIVVHVGKHKNEMTVEQALNNMEAAIRKILVYATADCPLILETPAGQGTELCTLFQDFLSFFQRFKGDSRFKCCIDSCHIFAANYDPLEYLKGWQQFAPGTLQLLHFNDSKTPQGSKTDRHAAMGTGYIGYEKLLAVAQFCVDNSIPMVVEY